MLSSRFLSSSLDIGISLSKSYGGLSSKARSSSPLHSCAGSGQESLSVRCSSRVSCLPVARMREAELPSQHQKAQLWVKFCKLGTVGTGAGGDLYSQNRQLWGFSLLRVLSGFTVFMKMDIFLLCGPLLIHVVSSPPC